MIPSAHFIKGETSFTLDCLPGRIFHYKRAPDSATQPVDLLDAAARKTVRIWIDVQDAAAQLNLSPCDPIFSEGRFSQSVERFTLLNAALRKVTPVIQQKFPHSFIEPSQVEKMAQWVAAKESSLPEPRFVRFNPKETKLPVGGCLTKAGNLFLDMRFSQLGVGSFRHFSRAVWVNEQEVVARGFSFQSESDRSEARALRTFRGLPGMIYTYAYGIDNDQFYIYQPVFEKGDLFTCIDRGEKIPFKDKLKMAGEWISLVHEFSKHGVHRDIRLENILMEFTTENVWIGKITDFNLFSFNDARRKGIQNFLIETAPPEWVKARSLKEFERVTTSRVDVWMLGIVLYRLFGKNPEWFEFENVRDQIEMILELEPNWAHLPDIPAPLADLIKGMLHPDPVQRLSAPLADQIFSQMKIDGFPL